MKEDIECHRCKKEFESEWNVRGECPYCGNRYEWAWEGELWSDTETCIVVFASEPECIKKAFLLETEWLDNRLPTPGPEE